MNLTCDDNWRGVHIKRVYKVNDGQEMVLACDAEFLLSQVAPYVEVSVSLCLQVFGR